jgi:hypothetical protein
MRESRNLRLSLIPDKPVISQTRVQNNGRRTLPDTVKVHAVAAHVHHEAGRVIQMPIATLFDLLVDETDAGEKQN